MNHQSPSRQHRDISKGSGPQRFISTTSRRPQFLAPSEFHAPSLNSGAFHISHPIRTWGRCLGWLRRNASVRSPDQSHHLQSRDTSPPPRWARGRSAPATRRSDDDQCGTLPAAASPDRVPLDLMNRHPGNRHRRAFNEPGHAHALTFTCYRRFKFLASERTRAWLASAIDDARSKLDFSLWAFVFMPEHARLVVWPRRIEYEVAAILKAIKEPVGRRAVEHIRRHAPIWLPRITRRRGQRVERLFRQSGGGYDRNILDRRTLMGIVDYVHHNPVRRGLVERASDWRWSSAGWHEGNSTCPLVPDRIPPDWVPLD